MYARYLTLKSKFLMSDHGASMVEYSLLVVLIAIVAFVAVQIFGSTLSGTYGEIADDLAWANQT